MHNIVSNFHQSVIISLNPSNTIQLKSSWYTNWMFANTSAQDTDYILSNSNMQAT
jgi:hypothetical protein